ncbi:hypothetical protein Dsin_008627 [Dipteronia sinensis]|uniref:Reverse transcriptase zinc-binding domain-containing protein n=1 Tax=Dipteronia sinensis TaxID=43782 RepID=A0AAE0EBC0_9ROSI|nr:hypothetical protein Dsin_008627 [Dipteronia sinensis]
MVRCHESHMGLPSFGGRNKRGLFNYIKDRMWERVKGWKGKLLSVGGKEVLIRSVLQSIPAYTMNLFRLLKSLVTDLHRLCSRFWWGSSVVLRQLRRCIGLRGRGYVVIRVLGDNIYLVRHLRTDYGGWNNQLVRQFSFKEDAKMILSIPLSNTCRDDSITWYFTADGEYMVRSGYNLGMCRMVAESNIGGSSNSGLENAESFRKNLWRINVPNKIKLFIWKACNDWLPTRANLAMKGIPADPTCVLCYRSHETTKHELWGCAKLKEIQSICGFLQGLSWKDCLNFKDFFFSYAHSIQCEDLALLSVLFWRILFLRNQQIHDIAEEDEASEVVRWEPPLEYLYKINVEAAIKVQDNCVGVGIVICNHCGLIMGSSAQRIDVNFSIQIAEAVAILRGIVFAKDMGLLPAVVESDALGVVNLTNTGSAISADVGVVFSDILNVISDCFWVEECPPSAGSLVLRDFPL